MSGRILIADTSSASRILLRARLGTARYAVTMAATGAEVMERLRADRPDLLIADATLPDITGVTLLRTIRADAELARFPVILLTDTNADAARIEALEAGADEFLVKPIDGVTLMARVRSIFRASETEEALDRRRVTVRELVFAEAASGFAGPATLAFVGPSPAEADRWAGGLSGLVRAPIRSLGPDEALRLADTGPAPDLFLIAADLMLPGDGLRLLVDLRSRAATR